MSDREGGHPGIKFRPRRSRRGIKRGNKSDISDLSISPVDSLNAICKQKQMKALGRAPSTNQGLSRLIPKGNGPDSPALTSGMRLMCACAPCASTQLTALNVGVIL
jgi:hypothetical protein